MRIYCSGPMTGIPDHNIPAFNAAAERLRKEGHFVINPAELSAIFGTPVEIAESFGDYYAQRDYMVDGSGIKVEGIGVYTKSSILARAVMSADLAAVRSCDAIYLLRGWETSRGAKKELAEAIANGLKVMQEETA